MFNLKSDLAWAGLAVIIFAAWAGCVMSFSAWMSAVDYPLESGLWTAFCCGLMGAVIVGAVSIVLGAAKIVAFLTELVWSAFTRTPEPIHRWKVPMATIGRVQCLMAQGVPNHRIEDILDQEEAKEG